MYKSNFDDFKRKFGEAVPKTLHSIGIFVTGETQARCPVGKYTDGRVGGNLRGSYTYEVNEQEGSVTIGSPVEYAPHVELGTRKMDSRPHLRPAVERNLSRIGNLIKENLNVG